MCKGYIYRHWIDKSYIGQTSRYDVKLRWQNGLGYLYDGSKKDGKATHKFANAIRKYGWDNFNHEILLTIECETEEELDFWLDEWECYYIEKYDSYYNGYNSTLGGAKGKCDGTKVVCLNTARVFKSVVDASNWCQTPTSSIFNVCNGERNYSGRHPETNEKLVWRFLEDYNNLDEEQIQELLDKPYECAIVCLNTGIVFDGAVECAKWCGGINKRNNICKCCNNERRSCGKHPETGEPLVWRYLNDYKTLTQEEIEQLVDVNNNRKIGAKHPNAKKVICLTTKEVFETSKYGADTYGLENTNVIKCCRGKRVSTGKHPETGEKLKWMYYEDYLKLNENSDSKTEVA